MLRAHSLIAGLALLIATMDARPQELVTNVSWTEVYDSMSKWLAKPENFGEVVETTADLAEAYGDYTEMARAFEPLSELDTAYDPDYSPAGSPQIPSGCAESGECMACYEAAVKDINFNRFYLDKMRSIVNSTIKYAEKSMAFGDSASGLHAVSGMAWSIEGKPQIEQAVTDLRKTYDRKYQVYMSNLETALRNLGQCEAEHFDEPDWYDRFGFMYYTFMADRYREPD